MPGVQQQNNVAQLKAHDEQLERLGFPGFRNCRDADATIELGFLQNSVKHLGCDWNRIGRLPPNVC